MSRIPPTIDASTPLPSLVLTPAVTPAADAAADAPTRAPAPLVVRPQPGAGLARAAAVYLARLAAGSRPTMLDSLKRIVAVVQPGAAIDTFPWGALRYDHAQAIRSALAGQYAPATVNRHLAALRGVLREAWKLGMMTAEELERALSFDPVRGNSPQAGRMLDPEEISRLFDACGDDVRGRRDAAILAVAAFGGLRRAEIAGLTVASYLPDRLKVHGKGNKHREVPITGAAIDYLDRWLEVRGRSAGPLFNKMRRGGHFRPEEPISPNGIWVVIASVVERVALTHATPHDFRRTYVSLLLDKHDAKTVQDLAGHARVDTTMRYDRRGDERKVEAATTIADIMQRLPRTCACGQSFVYNAQVDCFRYQCDRCLADLAVRKQRQHSERLTKERVAQANARARACGAPATLTLTAWIATVRAFKGLCAYCGKAEFDVIEHAVPLPEGGTTKENCLPACVLCNNQKGPRTLAEWLPAEHPARVYLAGAMKPRKS